MSEAERNYIGYTVFVPVFISLGGVGTAHFPLSPHCINPDGCTYYLIVTSFINYYPFRLHNLPKYCIIYVMKLFTFHMECKESLY